MNELELINKHSSLTKLRKSKKYKSIKKNYISGLSKNKFFPKKYITLLLIAFILLIIIIIATFIKKLIIKSSNNINQTKLVLKNNIYLTFNENYNLTKEENEISPFCNEFDPTYLFYLRMKNKEKTICDNGYSKHMCYQNDDFNYNQIFYHKNGVICLMKNIILDPLKSNPNKYVFNGPVDFTDHGFPLSSKGLFNMKCDSPNLIRNYESNYKYYFNSWNYEYQDEKENLEELAPGKVIFFFSRCQDSPNLFHGGSEVINAISMMELFNLKPEDIQVVFLDSITLDYKFDPLFDVFKNVISRGGEPLYIKNLKKKYLISSAIHIPIGWDSTLFLTNDIKYQSPECKYPSRTFKFFNDLINKYLEIPTFSDSFVSDNEIFYYPKSVIEYHNSNNKFDKYITIQWRKPWPKVRRGQARILAKAPEIADKIASLVPKNYLVRLVDTGGLHLKKQISIMRNTDYLIGIHGAGLTLSIFMPSKSILHEINQSSNMIVPRTMSILSGHKTFNDRIEAEIKKINDNEIVFFNIDELGKKVLDRMKEINFI